MSLILFGDVGNYYYSVPTEVVEWSDTIRLFIFLVYSECLGLPALVWAFRILQRHQKSHGRTSVFASLLLHNNILELLLNLYIIAVLLQHDMCSQMHEVCNILVCLWSGSRICGVLLQQMVVLERILSLKHLFGSARVFFPLCSIIVYLLVLIVFFLCEFFASRLYPPFSLVSLVPVLAVTVASWIITCRKPPIKDHSSNRTENQDYTVLAFATLTAALYTISLALYVREIWSVWVMSLCVLSLRVITDAPLCVLICREKHSQTHSDLSTDPAADQAEQTVICMMNM